MFAGICFNNYIIIILTIYYMNSGKNNLFLRFCDLCKAKTYQTECVIVWKLLLLSENFILGLTPSLKTSGMPFSVLPCGRSLRVIRAGYLSEKRQTLSEVCSLCENRNGIILFPTNTYGRKAFVFGFMCFENEYSDLFVLPFSWFVPLK